MGLSYACLFHTIWSSVIPALMSQICTDHIQIRRASLLHMMFLCCDPFGLNSGDNLLGKTTICVSFCVVCFCCCTWFCPAVLPRAWSFEELSVMFHVTLQFAATILHNELLRAMKRGFEGLACTQGRLG